jgi:hypothetical protein
VAIDSRTAGRRCIVIAGPNGAGKTTFAREFLPRDAGIVRFVNVDLIAGGLSPLRPDLVALAAGRLYLAELDRLARAELDFAFETTLSGLMLVSRLKRWKSAGYRIEIIFLQLGSSQYAASLAEFGRAAMTCRAKTSSGASTAAGATSARSIGPSPMPGQSTTTPGTRPDCWRKDHEEQEQEQRTDERVRHQCRSCLAPSRSAGPSHRARLRHAALRLAKRQGSGREALTGSCSASTSAGSDANRKISPQARGEALLIATSPWPRPTAPGLQTRNQEPQTARRYAPK